MDRSTGAVIRRRPWCDTRTTLKGSATPGEPEMTYITETLEYGRKRQAVDLSRFAADLTKALAKLLPTVKVQHTPPTEYVDAHQAIMVGTDRLDLRSNSYQSKCRVIVYLDAPDVPHGDWSTYDKEQRTESATVNPDGRSIEAIARDINKRVIFANQPVLAKRRAYAKQQADNRATIVKHAADLKTAVPALDIRINEREQRAAIFGGSNFAGYLTGTLHADGTVNVDRLGSISNQQFRKIVAILAEKGGDR